MFKKYQHLDKLGSQGTEGILDGECYVFPKLDGTNASLWSEEGKICAGSRTRQLSEDSDNAGFYKAMLVDPSIHKFFLSYPNIRLYGEWLVPHTLKTYKNHAWRKFYVFDVVNEDANGKFEYVPYDVYKEWLDFAGLNYIPPYFKSDKLTSDNLNEFLDKNDYLVAEGVGEGLVVKRYDYVNRFGHIVWAKVVHSDFKDALKKFKINDLEFAEPIETKIVNAFLNQSLIDKVYAKLCVANEDSLFNKKQIPQLLNTVWYDFVHEELWEVLKKYKNPEIKFDKLQNEVYRAVRKGLPQVF